MVGWLNKFTGALVPALAASAITIEALRTVSLDHFWLGEALSFLRLPRWIAATIPIVIAWWGALVWRPWGRFEHWPFSRLEWRAAWSLWFAGIMTLNVVMIGGAGLDVSARPSLILCCAGLDHAAAQVIRASGIRLIANALSVMLVVFAYAAFHLWPLAGGYRYAIDRYFDRVGYESLSTWAHSRLAYYEKQPRSQETRRLDRAEMPEFVRQIPTLGRASYGRTYYADGPHLLLGVGVSRADNSVILIGRPDFVPHSHDRSRWRRLAPGIWIGRS